MSAASKGRGRMKRGGRNPLGKPNPIDIHVGGRIRERRIILGMSQAKLGEALGLTFQQVQKYERGTNRVGSSRMFVLARTLDVPIAYFFEGMGSGKNARSLSAPATNGTDDQDPMARRETLELVRAYYKIVDPRVRKRLFEMTKAIGATGAVSAS